MSKPKKLQTQLEPTVNQLHSKIFPKPFRKSRSPTDSREYFKRSFFPYSNGVKLQNPSVSKELCALNKLFDELYITRSYGSPALRNPQADYTVGKLGQIFNVMMPCLDTSDKAQLLKKTFNVQFQQRGWYQEDPRFDGGVNDEYEDDLLSDDDDENIASSSCNM